MYSIINRPHCSFEMCIFWGCACQRHPHKPVVICSLQLWAVIFSLKMLILAQLKSYSDMMNRIQNKKYHNLERIEICATVLLKWTDFSSVFLKWTDFSRDDATFVNVVIFCAPYRTERLFSLIFHGVEFCFELCFIF